MQMSVKRCILIPGVNMTGRIKAVFCAHSCAIHFDISKLTTVTIGVTYLLKSIYHKYIVYITNFVRNEHILSQCVIMNWKWHYNKPYQFI